MFCGTHCDVGRCKMLTPLHHTTVLPSCSYLMEAVLRVEQTRRVYVTSKEEAEASEMNQHVIILGYIGRMTEAQTTGGASRSRLGQATRIRFCMSAWQVHTFYITLAHGQTAWVRCSQNRGSRGYAVTGARSRSQSISSMASRCRNSPRLGGL
jgi:hypothetical protein